MKTNDFNEILTKAADGDVTAMQTIAECYRVGDGVELNWKESIRWRERAGETNITFVVPPGAYKNGNVEFIPGRIFGNCESLTAVVLPANVSLIIEDAFFGCSSLESINLDNVSHVNKGAFCRCAALQSVTIRPQESIPGLGTTIRIGESAFGACLSLRSVTIAPSNCRGAWIEAKAFGNCKSLEQITLPANVKEIGWDAFEYCENLASIVVPKGTLATYQEILAKNNAEVVDKLREAE